jgi:hypothetical protein
MRNHRLENPNTIKKKFRLRVSNLSEYIAPKLVIRNDNNYSPLSKTMFISRIISFLFKTDIEEILLKAGKNTMQHNNSKSNVSIQELGRKTIVNLNGPLPVIPRYQP